MCSQWQAVKLHAGSGGDNYYRHRCRQLRMHCRLANAILKAWVSSRPPSWDASVAIVSCKGGSREPAADVRLVRRRCVVLTQRRLHQRRGRSVDTFAEGSTSGPSASLAFGPAGENRQVVQKRRMGEKDRLGPREGCEVVENNREADYSRRAAMP